MGKWLHQENKNEGRSTQYRLKGVLIHSGSAEAGHYYSYIRIQDQWMEFNDTGVRIFDASTENKHKEWFGSGKTTSPEKGFMPYGYGSSSTSAYMLFYDRVDAEASNSAPSEVHKPEANANSQKMMELINEENKFFLRKKIFADSVSLRFLDGVLSLFDTTDHLERLGTILVDQASSQIANQGLLDILVGRCVSYFIYLS